MTDGIGLAVLGGDERQIAMARMLAQNGYPVYVWGLGENQSELGKALVCKQWQDAVERSAVVILPLPASGDGVRVHCPLQDHDVFLRLPALLDMMQGRLLLGGRLNDAIRSIAEQKQIEWIDYYDNEFLQLKNAVPTAEGAIEIAMRELPVTLDGCESAIMGYGRIGRALGMRLHALGARVTVYARRREQLARAQIDYHQTCRLICKDGRSAPEFLSPNLRVIFNTVPQWIFTREVLQALSPKCLLVDLASAPGGIDRAAADALGIKTIWGTALPGKCAPETAGELIAQTVIGILEEYSISTDLYRKDG